MKKYSYNYQFFQNWMKENNIQINEVLGPMNTSSYQSVNRWMNGDMPMKIEAMLGLCNHFGISPSSFFLEDGKPINPALSQSSHQDEKTDSVLRSAGADKGCMLVKDSLNTALGMIAKASAMDTDDGAIFTGFDKIDELISGLQGGCLITIAGRPAMGKTSFALSLVRNATIEHKIPTLYFSLEMNSASVVNRIIANICSIPAHKIQNGKLLKEEWESLDNNIPSIAKAPLYLDDTARLSINDLSNTARNCVIDHGVKLIVIDYFQLIQTRDRSNRSRHDELAELMHELKILARELNVPIVLLSQLNRALEDREGFEGKRPKLSDLRECGAIEDDSDVVMFVHRPEYYHIYQDEMGRDLRGMAQIIIAKHRMGHTGDVLLTFNGKYTRFENLQSIQTPPLEISDELF